MLSSSIGGPNDRLTVADAVEELLAELDAEFEGMCRGCVEDELLVVDVGTVRTGCWCRLRRPVPFPAGLAVRLAGCWASSPSPGRRRNR